MDPGLARQTNPEPKRADPAFVKLSGNAQKPEPDDDEGDSFSTTTSDTSDGDDFFQIDPLGLGHPNPNEPVHSPQVPAQSNFNSFDDEGETSFPTKFPSRSPNEEQYQIQPSELRPPLSPVLPTMVRNDVPDPNRIPSSIFTRTKSTSPMEWSVASNESLFSIHMGNSSFSRDPVFFMGRSGELNTFIGVDSYPTPISSMPPAFPLVSPLPPPIPHVTSSPPTGLDPRLVPEKPSTAEASSGAAKTDVLRTETEEQDSDKESKKSDQDAVNFSKSMSHQSEGSATSFQSFAFPILTGDGGRSGSIKVGPEHQQMQQQQQPPLPLPLQPVEQQTPKVAENPAPTPAEDKGWLSCFSCCPSCR